MYILILSCCNVADKESTVYHSTSTDTVKLFSGEATTKQRTYLMRKIRDGVKKIAEFTSVSTAFWCHIKQLWYSILDFSQMDMATSKNQNQCRSYSKRFTSEIKSNQSLHSAHLQQEGWDEKFCKLLDEMVK